MAKFATFLRPAVKCVQNICFVCCLLFLHCDIQGMIVQSSSSSENQWQVHFLFLATRNGPFPWEKQEAEGGGEERLSDAGWHGNLARWKGAWEKKWRKEGEGFFLGLWRVAYQQPAFPPQSLAGCSVSSLPSGLLWRNRALLTSTKHPLHTHSAVQVLMYYTQSFVSNQELQLFLLFCLKLNMTSWKNVASMHKTLPNDNCKRSEEMLSIWCTAHIMHRILFNTAKDKE